MVLKSPKVKATNLATIFNNKVVRWWIVGIAFMVINIILLDFLKVNLQAWFSGLSRLSPEEVNRWSLSVATIASAEICTITRYLINDYWVFGNPRPTWKRCWEYHVANGMSFFVWCFIVIALGEKIGVDHRFAAILATVVSVCISMATNFLWVWRSPKKRPRPEEEG
ncbi:MAG: GtrA family protein [Snowella sp.]|nr:GtrA family protein [Snowella sp.]